MKHENAEMFSSSVAARVAGMAPGVFANWLDRKVIDFERAGTSLMPRRVFTREQLLRIALIAEFVAARFPVSVAAQIAASADLGAVDTAPADGLVTVVEVRPARYRIATVRPAEMLRDLFQPGDRWLHVVRVWRLRDRVETAVLSSILDGDEWR